MTYIHSYLMKHAHYKRSRMICKQSPEYFFRKGKMMMEILKMRTWRTLSCFCFFNIHQTKAEFGFKVLVIDTHSLQS